MYSAQTYVWKRLFQTGFGRSPKPAPAEIKVWQSPELVSQKQLLEKHGVQGEIAKECAHDQRPLLFPPGQLPQSLGRQPSFLGNTKTGQKIEWDSFLVKDKCWQGVSNL